MRNLVEMPTIQNVVPGGKCVLNLPIGMTYDELIFVCTNVTAAQMLNYKWKVGSKTIIDVSSFQVMEDLNAYYKRPQQAGHFTHWFYRPEVKEDIRALTSFGTIGVSSSSIEFDLAAGVVSPAIKVFAVQRNPQVMGLVTKLREYPLSFATAGKQQIDNIPRGARISAAHLQKADVSFVELEINNGTGPAKIVEASKSLLEAYQKQYDRAPVTAKYTHIDLNLTGDIAGPMPTAQLVDMRFKPTLDTSGNLTVLVEYIDGIDGI
ncbi:MAG: major capsid protein P2 [Cellvibrio sp.]|uniref:major capsid protein P2 n=1 Tax=Cellvibrio sp. TaxID=1965322 RepID=UPI0031AD5C6E